jgi:hypothetical protein
MLTGQRSLNLSNAVAILRFLRPGGKRVMKVVFKTSGCLSRKTLIYAYRFSVESFKANGPCKR